MNGQGFDESHLERWIARHEQSLVETVKALVRIPSVGEPFDATLPHPFGEQCARVIDASKPIVEGLGLAWRNHDYYAASARIPAATTTTAPAAPAKRPSIAFYSHLDVVPTGNGWKHDPFDPYVENGWIIGRGTTDNKGPAAAVLFAMKYLKESGIGLRHDVIAYLGCDEERTMQDIRFLMRTVPLPDVNLVTDAMFPVCIAEKGIIECTLTAQLDDPALIAFEGGTAHNAVPDRALVRIKAASGDVFERQFTGRGAHAAFAEGSVNAVVRAAQFLADEAGEGAEADEQPGQNHGVEHPARALSDASRAAFAFIAHAFADIYGEEAGIAGHDAITGKTTCVPVLASLSDGSLSITLNIRFATSENPDALVAALAQRAASAGFRISACDISPAHRVNDSDQLISLLTGIVNDELGTDLLPYGLPGGTHARHIPGALGFGPGRTDITLPFEQGHGRGHEPDEAVSIKHLEDAIRIYVRSVLAIDAL